MGPSLPQPSGFLLFPTVLAVSSLVMRLVSLIKFNSLRENIAIDISVSLDGQIIFNLPLVRPVQ